MTPDDVNDEARLTAAEIAELFHYLHCGPATMWAWLRTLSRESLKRHQTVLDAVYQRQEGKTRASA